MNASKSFFLGIPFFKDANFLKETLQSLLAQTDSNWSAMVYDDSIDPLEVKAANDLVASFADSRIQYAQNPKNLGMSQNWNQVLEQGKDHELVVILHADDRLKPEYVADIKAFAERHPNASAYFCKVDIIGAKGEPVFSLADWYKKILNPSSTEVELVGEKGIEKLIPGNFIFCPSICYRMSKIGNERFRQDLKMVTDFEYILRLLTNGGILVGTYEKSLFEYRRHSSNTTVTLTKNLTRFHEEIELYERLAKFLTVKGNRRLAKKAESMTVIKLNLGFQMLKSLLSFRLGDLKRETSLFLDLL